MRGRSRKPHCLGDWAKVVKLGFDIFSRVQLLVKLDSCYVHAALFMCFVQGLGDSRA